MLLKESVVSVRGEGVVVDGSMVAEITDPEQRRMVKEIEEMRSTSGEW